MNERIQSLIDQAQEPVDPYAVEGNFGPTQLNVGKFAQLIAKECARMAMAQHQSVSFETYDDLDEYERGQDDAASMISGQILFYFGLDKPA